MAYPTLPSTWSPSSQCVASTAFYYVVERTYSPSGTLPGGVIFSLMYGIPTPTVYGTITGATPSGTCVPPSFTTDVPYVTSEGRCPSGYSIACATGSSQAGGVASAITCCPSGVYNFECGVDPYGCQTIGSPGQIWSGYRTDIPLSTEEPNDFTVGEGNYMFAWGIKLLSTPSASATETAAGAIITGNEAGNTGLATVAMASSSASSLPAATASSAPTSPSDGAPAFSLSTGATAGIAVGATLGAVLLAMALCYFWVYKRRQARKLSTAVPAAPPYEAGDFGHDRETKYVTYKSPYELASHGRFHPSRASGGRHSPYELPT